MSKKRIVFDFSKLSRPYAMKRCSFQMMHMAIIAEKLDHDVVCLTDDTHQRQHPFLKKINRLFTKNQKVDGDIYVAKGDAYYRDANWDVVSKKKAFKVALCNSDRTFRESSEPFKKHRGNPIQDRADLYMPVNHSDELKDRENVIPAAHPIDPRMFNEFKSKRLYYAYLFNDLTKLRNAYKPASEVLRAGFMGNKIPSHRKTMSRIAPDWCDFNWERGKPSSFFINWLCERKGCLDLRGFGDKSLRFTEACIFGRTLICQRLPSLYHPQLVDGHNCILVDKWGDLDNYSPDQKQWDELSKQSEEDYVSSWSLYGQVQTFINKSGG
jgi:hypothetical protein